MSYCPSCGQFVGPRDTCPHCGAHLGGRMVIRTIKIAVAGATVVGLFVLWLLAGRAEPPLVPIGQVGATMNLAYVRLEGRITRSPSFAPESHTLTFWLADDTGEIYVAAYRHEAKDLMTSGRVPALGDRVSVVGTLRWREDFASLTINAPDQVMVTKPEPTERSVAEIDRDSALKRVRLRGQVRDIRSPYAGLTLIGLRDATGAIDVAVPQETLALTGGLTTPSPGQMVEVEGTVTFYKETPQLTLTDVADLTPLVEPTGIAPILLVSDLDAEAVGDWVGLQGIVTRIAPFSAGVKLTLDDGSDEITVLLWQDLYDGLPPATALAEGMALTVYGQVSEYRGQTELIPELPIDVQLADVTLLDRPTPTSVATPTALPTATATPAPTSQVVCTPPPCKGNEVYYCPGECPGGCGTQCATPTEPPTATPAPTPTVQAVCTPPPCKQDEVYYCPGECPGGCGTRCATPTPVATPTAVPAPTDTVIPTIAATAMGHIDAGFAGETLTVRGQVAGTASLPGGFMFTLNDGTGQIALLLWAEVYDAVADVAGLNIGATALVTGDIGEYEGELQIVPTAAGDVIVQVAGRGPDAPRREIGSLCAADVGTLAEIEGTISRVEGFSQGLQVYVTDGSGEVQLLLWQEVADRVPDGERLVAGAQVRAAGEVGEYRGTLQVVPHLPFDVEVWH